MSFAEVRLIREVVRLGLSLERCLFPVAAVLGCLRRLPGRIALCVVYATVCCAVVVGTTVMVLAQGILEPEGYRLKDYRAPVPLTLKGALVIDPDEAGKLWDNGEGGVIFIDVFPKPPTPNLPEGTVWREPKHESIKGATWLANVGFGVLSAQFDSYFRAGLKRLSGGDKAKRIVFFCLRDCWMSWNAAKRALSYGYTNVIWFPDGTDGWKDFDLPVVADVKPEP